MAPESPPHVPAPFPYLFPGPMVPPPRNQGLSFAHSSSRGVQEASSSFPSSKRTRTSSAASVSSSSGSDSDGESSGDNSGDLSDPYDLKGYEKPSLNPSYSSEGKLEETNVGMKMLLKLGWSEGKGLGKDLQGRAFPIDPGNNTGMMGLGKLSQDLRMIEQTAGMPRELESMKIARESQEEKTARMEKVFRKEVVKAEIGSSIAKFRCDICNKQYANVSQYDEHTNSYDHHHRARAVATKQMEKERLVASGESERRREKERKREEKEMLKKMGAAGVKIPPTGGVSVGLAASTAGVRKISDAQTSTSGGGWMKFGDKKPGFSPIGGGLAKSGFKPIAGSSQEFNKADTREGQGVKGGGWSAVGTSTGSGNLSTSPASSKASQIAAPEFQRGTAIPSTVDLTFATKPFVPPTSLTKLSPLPRDIPTPLPRETPPSPPLKSPPPPPPPPPSDLPPPPPPPPGLPPPPPPEFHPCLPSSSSGKHPQTPGIPRNRMPDSNSERPLSWNDQSSHRHSTLNAERYDESSPASQRYPPDGDAHKFKTLNTEQKWHHSMNGHNAPYDRQSPSSTDERRRSEAHSGHYSGNADRRSGWSRGR